MTTFFNPLTHKIFSTIKSSVQCSCKNMSLFWRKSKRMNQLSPYIIHKACIDDNSKILKVMHEAYYPDEPTISTLGIKQNALLDEYVWKALNEGMTQVARCKYDGNIVGACINTSTHSWDPIMKERMACSVQCSKVRQLLLFEAHVQEYPGLWQCYDVNKIFEMSYIFVLPAHRRRGIAYRLMKDSIELGTDCGFTVLRCDATSHCSAKLCEKLNMKLAAEVPYCSYLGKNLEPVFRPPHPNVGVKIYIDDNPQLHNLIRGKTKHKEQRIT